MDASLHRRASETFLAACDLPPGERADHVARACAGDAELAAAVAAMLEADTHAGAFLESSPGRALREEAERLPERVGPFRVVALLGRGAMGTVFEAEQDAPRRRVAVKVQQPGLLSRSLLDRFRYEAELLGRLQHPGIAHRGRRVRCWRTTAFWCWPRRCASPRTTARARRATERSRCARAASRRGPAGPVRGPATTSSRVAPGQRAGGAGRAGGAHARGRVALEAADQQGGV